MIPGLIKSWTSALRDSYEISAVQLQGQTLYLVDAGFANDKASMTSAVLRGVSSGMVCILTTVQRYRRPRLCLETFMGGGSYENLREDQVSVMFSEPDRTYFPICNKQTIQLIIQLPKAMAQRPTSEAKSS
jgi:hypothetical protein